jgi:hypothetical protein
MRREISAADGSRRTRAAKEQCQRHGPGPETHTDSNQLDGVDHANQFEAGAADDSAETEETKRREYQGHPAEPASIGHGGL